jgi:hypothetical protein
LKNILLRETVDSLKEKIKEGRCDSREEENKRMKEAGPGSRAD